PPFPDEIVDAVLLCIDPAELRKIAEAVPAEIFVKSIASFRAQFAAALTKRIGASNVEKARAWLEENSVSAQGSWLH
ncbi:MAG TPA: hypothetical protein VGS59_13985, partial [Candidatus Acidoferrales bacterium]|nr:hypothetical protein [Candidatus Acidoferrales bacterium]